MNSSIGRFTEAVPRECGKANCALWLCVKLKFELYLHTAIKIDFKLLESIHWQNPAPLALLPIQMQRIKKLNIRFAQDR